MSHLKSRPYSLLVFALVASTAMFLVAGLTGVSTASAAPQPRGEVKPWKPVKPLKKVKKWSKLNVQSPNNPSGMHNELINIDCDGPNCTAVGLWGPSPDVSKPTFSRLRAKQTRSSAAPTRVIPGSKVGDQAKSISCVGQNWCMVVGNTHKNTPADLTWSTLMSKGKWSKKATVTPSNGMGGQAYLFGVSCTTTKNCLAVGHYFNPDGDPRGLVLRWNGKAWNRILSSKFFGDMLVDVDCVTSKNCVVVGSGRNGSKAYRFKNNRLSTIKGPALPASQLASVSCVDAKWCGASGGTIDKPLVVRINGSSMRKVGIGKSKGIQGTYGISCSAKNRCTAATSWQDSQRFAHPAIWRWRGANRKMTILPGAAKAVGGMNAVSCQPTRCVAVGENYVKGDMFYRLLNNAFQGPPN